MKGLTGKKIGKIIHERNLECRLPVSDVNLHACQDEWEDCVEVLQEHGLIVVHDTDTSRILIVTPELFNEEYIYIHGKKYKWMSSRETYLHDNYPLRWWINTYSEVKVDEKE